MYLVSARPQVLFFRLLLVLGVVICFSPIHLASAADPLININTADPATLAEQLPGIGPTKALAIVSYREQFGLFETLEQLTEVKGIGPSTLEKIRPLIFIDATDLQQSTNAWPTETIQPLRRTQHEYETAAREAVRAAIEIARQYEVDFSPQQ